MKRHIMLTLLRLLLAVGVRYALPFSHIQWGMPYPGEGQQAFVIIIIFSIFSLVAAGVFFGLGSLGQFLLRKRPARLTLLTDLGLLLLFTGILVHAGVTARYNN